MNLIMLSIGCLVFYIFWKQAWQRIIIGYYRDRIFSIRDALRSWSLQNGCQLDDTWYVNIRTYINSSVRYLDTYSFIEFSAFSYTVAGEENTEKLLADEIGKIFLNSDDVFAKQAQEIRSEISAIIKKFMILRSFPMCMAFALLSAIYAVIYLLRFVYTTIVSRTYQKVSLREFTTQALTACIIFLSLASPGKMRTPGPQLNKSEAAIIYSDGTIML